MNIRDFTDKDFEAIESIYNRSKLDELRFENGKFELLPLSKDVDRLNNLIESKICVYESDRIHGYAAYLGAEIRALFVDPMSRGQGIGSKLLKHILQRVTHPATLYVVNTNEPAKLLYSRHGFQVIDDFITTYNGVFVLANKMLRSNCECGESITSSDV